MMVNPLTAPTPVAPIEPSPYYPSSRRFRNPLFLRIEELPGWEALPEDQRARLTSAGTALNRDRHIDRDAIFRLKQEALESLFAGFRGDDGFDWFCAGEGQALTDFATYAALAERHGKDWRRWPDGLRRSDGADIAALPRRGGARESASTPGRSGCMDAQLARASREIAIVHDLPIGLDVAGADAWCWQDLLARDVSVGAPADEFNANGQDWGLTPFIPWRLRAARYRPFIETIRAMLSHAGGLRIDHVMGLFRLFWIPRAARREGRRLRALARRRAAGDRRAREPARARVHRRRGPGHRRGGRAREAGRRSACCRTGCSTSNRSRPHSSRSWRCPASRPTICRRSPACGAAPIWRR